MPINPSRVHAVASSRSVRINAGRKRIFLGKYPTAELAARVYDRATWIFNGQAAK